MKIPEDKGAKYFPLIKDHANIIAIRINIILFRLFTSTYLFYKFYM